VRPLQLELAQCQHITPSDKLLKKFVAKAEAQAEYNRSISTSRSAGICHKFLQQFIRQRNNLCPPVLNHTGNRCTLAKDQIVIDLLVAVFKTRFKQYRCLPLEDFY
jgi:hypothetical protein